ncbi:MAG: hypothetical protein OEO23_00910 [Gemmatimonadota bacterium]|nr:hypothetical protein [Gemmatimonadota bacterium]
MQAQPPPPRPRYEIDAYTRSIRSRVVEVADDREWVILADTVLYPEGGGQPSDHGSLAGIPVSELARTPKGVRHSLSQPLPPGMADEVEVTVDWPRRFDHMQQHTAQHLLTAIAQERLGRPTTSFHLGASVSDIELDGPALTDGDLDQLEEEVNQAVREARGVNVQRVTREEYEARSDIRTRGLPDHHVGDVRLIEIEGLDLTACGGTHVASTAELEGVKLLGTEKMRGGARLYWVAGSRVRHRLGDHEARAEALRSALGVPTDELVETACQRLEQVKEVQREARILEEELADALVSAFRLDPGRLVSRHFESRGAGFLKSLASRFAEGAEGKVGFFTASAGGPVAFVVVAGEHSGFAASALGAEVASALGARGGGRDPIFQGKAPNLDGWDAARALLSRTMGT